MGQIRLWGLKQAKGRRDLTDEEELQKRILMGIIIEKLKEARNEYEGDWEDREEKAEMASYIRTLVTLLKEVRVDLGIGTEKMVEKVVAQTKLPPRETRKLKAVLASQEETVRKISEKLARARTASTIEKYTEKLDDAETAAVETKEKLGMIKVKPGEREESKRREELGRAMGVVRETSVKLKNPGKNKEELTKRLQKYQDKVKEIRKSLGIANREESLRLEMKELSDKIKTLNTKTDKEEKNMLMRAWFESGKKLKETRKKKEKVVKST
ncbi:Hypothetical predicted protein [Paramuricea clavata]|uniref:Uncharacterized protein n=1 Tax=Paramuricea clavata TaxID=317549 RepID=A0A6S7IVI0_PARCT|nr:Hypothetical predicted protein [Paramuricea clavata]